MQMSPKPMQLLTLTIFLVLTGCVTDSTALVGDYCRIAKPIGYDSRTDTAETVKEIEAHNSKWACVCDKDCPAGIAP
jgi:hypothetical protein